MLKFQIQFLHVLAIAGSVFLSVRQVNAQSTIPPPQTPLSPGYQAPPVPGQPAPGTYDPRNPSNNYSSPGNNTNQAYPNNQSPAGQPDPGINLNTNPVRPEPAQPGMNPNANPILQPTQPDVNNNKQVSPTGAGNVNPAKKDSL